MRRMLVLVICSGLLACGRSPSKPQVEGPPADPHVVAAWHGGVATLADVEGALLSLAPEERKSGEGDIVETYRATARECAVTRILLPKPSASGKAEWASHAQELYRQTLAGLFTRDVALKGRNIVVGEEEMKAYQREHPQQFHRPAQVYLYTIFRRRAQGEAPGASVEFLASLRKRVLAGEAFAELARANSDSETRALDGLVGWVARGAMAPQLERVAFALKAGEVSEPVAVPSGVVLLYADKVIPEKDFSYEDARAEIHKQLEKKKIREALTAWAKGSTIPEGSLILSHPELKEALATGGDDRAVLKILEVTLNKGELKKAIPPAAGANAPDELVWQIYEQKVRYGMILAEAARTGYAERPAVRIELERLLKRSLDRRAVEERIDARLKGDLAPKDDALRPFYDQHPQRYAGPLKLRLRRLSVDKVQSLGRRLSEMEEARAALVDGKLTLEDAARKLGGSIEEIGWREAVNLESLDDKERRYVLDLKSAGYTVPYQYHGGLRLIQVAERQEPVRRPYEQVRAEVLADYLKENRKDLLEGAANKILADAGFSFFEDRVREALAVTTPAALATPSAGGAPAK